MIIHPNINKLSCLLDGDIPEKKLLRISTHIDHCQSCKKKLQLLQGYEKVNVPKKEITADFRKMLVNALPEMHHLTQPILGEIKSIKGMVEIFNNGNQQGVMAFPGLAIMNGDSLHVTSNSLALIELNDGSNLYINKETEIKFSAGKYPLLLSLGEIFAMMKAQKNLFEIKTPSAVLGVIGTEFDAKVTEQKQTILQVLKGSVYFKNDSGSTIVKKKCQVEASPTTQPVPMRIKDTRSISTWTGTISPRPDKGGWIPKKIILGIVALLVLGTIVFGGYTFYNYHFGSVPYSYTPPALTTPTPTAPAPESAPAQTLTQSPAVQESESAVIIPGNDILVSRPRMQVGKRFIFQIDQSNKTLLQVPEASMETHEIVTQKIAVSNLEELSGGGYFNEFAFLSISVAQESPRGNFTVSSDSAAPQNPKIKPAWNMLKALTGGKIYLYINKDWDLVKIDGLDKIIARVKATCPSPVVQSIQIALNENSTKDNLKICGRVVPNHLLNVGSAFFTFFSYDTISQRVLPNHPVKVGDVWKVPDKMNIAWLGKTNSEMKYKFARWEKHNGYQCIVLELNGTLASKGADNLPPLSLKMSIRDGSISGTIWYDPVNDAIVDLALIQHLNLDIVEKIRDTEDKWTGQVTNDIRTHLIAVENIQ